MGSGWKVGRLAGIDISIHPSWLVIAFLITYSLAGSQFPRQFRGWTEGQYWIVAGATAALFFGSVLAHELSHAILARRFGLKVEGITLFIFGGVDLDRHGLSNAARGGADRRGRSRDEPADRRGARGDRRVRRPAPARRTDRLAGVRQHRARDLQPHPGLPDGRRTGPARPHLEAARRPVRRRPATPPWSGGFSPTPSSASGSSSRFSRAGSSADCGWRSSAGSCRMPPRRR